MKMSGDEGEKPENIITLPREVKEFSFQQFPLKLELSKFPKSFKMR